MKKRSIGKIFSINLCGTLLLLSLSTNNLAQDILSLEIPVLLEKGTKAQFLDTIKQYTDYSFLYSSYIKPDEEVIIKTGKYKVITILDSLFSDQTIDYIVKNDLIILSPQTHRSIAQKNVVLTGKVLSRYNEPISFATVYFENSSYGTMANEEGKFRFVVPKKLEDDSLCISSIGYKIQKIPPEVYLTGDIMVRLRSSSIPIKDIIIRPDVPEDIVRHSFDSRDINYSSKPTIITAFYREYSKQNDEYISLSEALVKVKKASYSGTAVDVVQLTKGRNGTNIVQSEVLKLITQGGLYNGFRLDIAKYKSYFYSEGQNDECDYTFIETTVFRGRRTYVIGFKMKEGIYDGYYSGKLYIDINSLALVRAEYELNKSGIIPVLIKKLPYGYKIKPEYAKYVVEYRFYSGLWNLYYAKKDLKIHINKARGRKNKGFSCDFTSTAEFVVTSQNEADDQRFRWRDASKPGDVLFEQIKNTKNNFWIDYNIIVPEEPLIKTIKKLQTKGMLMDEKENEPKQ